jgi:hypothetical protein
MLRELERVLDEDALFCLLRVRPSYFIVSKSGGRELSTARVLCSISYKMREKTMTQISRQRTTSVLKTFGFQEIDSCRKPRFAGIGIMAYPDRERH